ncbi:MAG: rhomboid family intramembrane serine protease [Frankia sp.]|nr:rhomboid family intramembrane serine protease [Frankia sp.]
MRPAAVGFHCPDEGGAQVPQRAARGALGGAGAASSGVVTKVLAAICVIAYFLQGLPGLGRSTRANDFTIDFALIGLRIDQGHLIGIAGNDEYYRLVTAAFLHGSVLHILFNVYALYLLGTQLEAVLGRARLLVLFLAGAIGGNTLSYLMNGINTFSVGASTAIFAFFAAYYIIARRLRVDTRQIVIVVGLNLVITFLIPNVDKWGHLGGLGVGVLMGLLYSYVPARRVILQAAGTAALIGLLVLGAVLKTQAITNGVL